MTLEPETGPAFRGDREFLSNFYPAPITGKDGRVYPTVEHAYQACKTTDGPWRERIRTAPTPAQAKRLGRLAPLRPDWDDLRYDLMRRLLEAKFGQHPDLAAKLMATTGELVERNTWHDQFWGVCVCPRHGGRGANHLGYQLDRLRDDLRRAEVARLAATPGGSDDPPPPSGVREVAGDLFALSPAPDALVNSVNCVGAMGRGVALAFKTAYPELYRDYRRVCAAHAFPPGSCWLWRAPGTPLVVNLAVKDDWRNPARMDWIASGLQEIADHYREWGIRSLALPHLGAMNGGLPWPPVRALIHATLGGLPGLDVTLVAYRP